MAARRLHGWAARLLVWCLLPAALAAQDEKVGLVDYYGYGNLTRAQLDAAFGLKAGDPMPAGKGAIETRLRKLPGVSQVYVHKVCCDNKGNPMLFGGLQRAGAPTVSFLARPKGSIRAADSLRLAYNTFIEQLIEGIKAGQSADDVSEGHSLLAFPPAREAQLAMRRYVVAHEAEVKRVLKESREDEDRAMAAQALGYAADKKTVIPDLVAAAFDSYGETRNNAVRALYAIGILAQKHPELELQVPIERVIPLLYSIEWTDRNKTSLALYSLSESRDPALLAALKAKALEPLLEMARWQSEGHAFPGYFIVARIAGVSDEEAFRAFQAGEREQILARVSPH
jgi:hypothetical protein